MAILNDTQINGNLNVTEDIQIGGTNIYDYTNAVVAGNITNNVFGVNIPYYKIGKLVIIVIDALKINKIPNTSAWNRAIIGTLPSDIIPTVPTYFPVVIDKCHYIKDTSGAEQRLNTDYAIMVSSDGKLQFVTRYAEAKFSTLTDGYGMFTTLTYVCK